MKHFPNPFCGTKRIVSPGFQNCPYTWLSVDLLSRSCSIGDFSAIYTAKFAGNIINIRYEGMVFPYWYKVLEV
jgi:hypothetical protein